MKMLLAFDTSWVETLVKAIFKILGPVLTLVAVAGIIYAIVVGVKFAKADDKSQRDEAKQKLITVIVGIVVTAVLIALFYWVSINITEWIADIDSDRVDLMIGMMR